MKKMSMTKKTNEGWDGVASEAKWAATKASLATSKPKKVMTRDEASRARAKKLLDKGM